MKVCTLLCIFLVLFVSCASFGTTFKARSEGLPEWCYEPNVGILSTKYCFVCAGNGKTSGEARHEAYNDFINQLSNYLNKEIGSLTAKELESTGKIEKYAIRQKDTFVRRNEDSITVFLRFIADKQLLEADRGIRSVLNEDILESVKKTIENGDNAILANNDVKAVSYYLKSMALTYKKQFIPSEYSYEKIKEEVVFILNSIETDINGKEIIRHDNFNNDCVITVIRKEYRSSFPVQSCPISARYKAVSVNGEVYDDSFTFSTDAKGHVYFSPVNKALTPEGQILFSIDLEDELSAIEEQGADVSDIRKLIEEKNLVLEYRQTFPDVLIGVVSFDYSDRAFRIEGDTADYIAGQFSRNRMSAFPYETEDGEDGVTIENFSIDYPEVPYLVICRIEHDKTFKSESNNEFNALCEGSVNVYDMRTKTIFYSSGICYSSAFGQTKEEAVANAFTSLADIFLSLMRARYV